MGKNKQTVKCGTHYAWLTRLWCLVVRQVSTIAIGSLVPRPAPSFPSLAVRLSGRGPGTFPHVSDVTDRANYANVGVM